MDGMSMEIRDAVGEKFPIFGDLDRTRDALSAYAEHRWPLGRRKAVMREWDLTDDEARSVCTGRASWQTFDKIISHKRGRWAVLFPIFGALLDETAEHFISQARNAHAQRAERLGALVGDPWLLRHDRRPNPPDRPDALDERPRSFRRRAG
jgi:hypothetical protein